MHYKLNLLLLRMRSGHSLNCRINSEFSDHSLVTRTIATAYKEEICFVAVPGHESFNKAIDLLDVIHKPSSIPAR